MQVRDKVVVARAGLDGIIEVLESRGYRVTGPVVRDGAIVHGRLSATMDLPVGCHDQQAPGTYLLETGTDQALFGWAVGPSSWKADFFPPRETVWRADPPDGTGARRIDEPADESGPTAVFGARPCELAALDVLDRVLGDSAVPDPSYRRRRSGTFVVAAECGAPAATCFCTSMGTGPQATAGYDLAVCELQPGEDGAHEYLVEAGSDAGVDVLAEVTSRRAGAADERARREVLAAAENGMTRALDVTGLPELLARTIDHPRWEETAERCLSCGNCTMVCPTCFCSDIHDVSDLHGTVERQRRWSSCFDRAHSYIHGGPVRPTTASCYRQWLTHKLSTWWDQFGSSGCVGCGRCISWCPVGIDLTEEVAALREGDRVGGGDRRA